MNSSSSSLPSSSSTSFIPSSVSATGDRPPSSSFPSSHPPFLPSSSSASAKPSVPSSNIGYKLLKKAGWKEGTGLGAQEQGAVEPVQAFVKKGKRGIGAKGARGPAVGAPAADRDRGSGQEDDGEVPGTGRAQKGRPTKRQKKAAAKAAAELRRSQEQELQRAFFREFHPDNV